MLRLADAHTHTNTHTRACKRTDLTAENKHKLLQALRNLGVAAQGHASISPLHSAYRKTAELEDMFDTLERRLAECAGEDPDAATAGGANVSAAPAVATPKPSSIVSASTPRPAVPPREAKQRES